MKIIKWIGIGLGVLVLVFIGFWAYMGMFSSVSVVEKDMGPYTLVYESFVGDYKDTGPVFERVQQALLKEGITASDGIGIYHDDPAKVPADQRRSDCGSILPEKDLGRVPELQQKYKIKVLEKKLSMVAVFPVKNTLSYMLGPMKGYKALADYAGAKGYRLAEPFEYYDMAGNKVCFVMPIEK
ncbi:MAG: hypothetical protein EHM45_13420 [Desulfobacteraceae bacterium]|nr:MAG: hypothetical protein EHM45_13420 [Desulfobacteraceae bacterium]